MTCEKTLKIFWTKFFDEADMIDKTKDNQISKKDLLLKIKTFYPRVDCSQAACIFMGLDEDKNGWVTLKELLHQMVELKDRRSAYKIMWNKITDGNPVADSISVRKAVLNCGATEAEFEKWFDKADKDHSGTISEQEFLDAMGVNANLETVSRQNRQIKT